MFKDYPIIKFAIGFTIGIVAQSIIGFNLIILISFLFISLFLTFIFYKIKKSVLLYQIFLLVVFVNIGSIVANLNKQEIITKLTDYHKEKNTIAFGIIESINLKKEYEISFILRLDSLIISEKKIETNEKLLCRLRSGGKDRKFFYDNFNPGNKISFKGTFTQPKSIRNPGEFDYKKYLLSEGITGILTSYDDNSFHLIDSDYSTYQTTVFNVRKYIDKLIHKLHNQKTAGLLRGLLLADRTEIDFETKKNFINAGVIHILAVSGLHVGYIVLFLIVVFGRFNLYVRSIFIILGIFSFMLITEVPPSVFRATLMTAIIIISFLSNRSTNLLNSISLSAVIILFVNPQQIFNPGFQLSYSAVLSIALIYPVIQKEITLIGITNQKVKAVLLFIGVSLAAQIGTLPFTVAYFNKISLISLVANLVVIPLTALIVGSAIITLLIGSITVSVASYLGITNNFLATVMFSFINFSGGLELSHIRISSYSILDGIIFYFFVSIFIYGFHKLSKLYLKLIFSLLIFFNIYLFSKIDDKEILPDGLLSILMIDVDQGDSFLIKFPNGKTALIDAGLANPFFDTGERIIIPLLDHLGIKKLDYGFISHYDNDHYGGFVTLLNNQRIKKVFIPEPDSSTKSIKFNKFLDKLGIPKKIYLREKYEIENVAIYILNDTSATYFNKLSSNDRSGIMKIVFGKKSFLFLGDVEIPAERYYVLKERKMLDSDVLKVGHHGSKTGSSEIFLKLVSPEISLISAGIKNKFGHPSEIVLERLEKLNSRILRTDSAGAILLQSDGNKIEIVDWRNH